MIVLLLVIAACCELAASFLAWVPTYSQPAGTANARHWWAVLLCFGLFLYLLAVLVGRVPL